MRVSSRWRYAEGSGEGVSGGDGDCGRPGGESRARTSGTLTSPISSHLTLTAFRSSFRFLFYELKLISPASCKLQIILNNYKIQFKIIGMKLLPEEIFLKITGTLGAHDLCSLAASSKSLHWCANIFPPFL